MTEQLPHPSPDMLPDALPHQAPPAEATAQAVNEWAMVSGAVLRELNKPEVRESLIQFSTTPVDEGLPLKMLESLPSTPLLDRVRGSASVLAEHAAAPPVEDERMVPDLSTSSPLRGGNKITIDEFEMVSKRYAMARDVKLLALGAELQNLGEKHPQPDEGGQITLPSGVRMIVGHEAGDDAASLLDPTTWEGRQQLKDRVYTFVAKGKRYVLKEEKTARHTDTLKNGHAPGLAPAEEFEVGTRMIERVTDKGDGISLEFERPLGHVEYPDGFKFGVFEYKDGLTNEDISRQDLTNAILENPSTFRKEFEAIATAVDGYKELPIVRSAYDAVPRRLGGQLLALVGLERNALGKRRLSFEDFAAAKAAQMHITGNFALKVARAQQGYTDPDTGGTMYAVDAANAKLSVVGLDYERYAKVPEEEQHLLESRIAKRMADIHAERLNGYDDNEFSSNSPAMERAATIALLERSDPRWTTSDH